MENKKLTKEEFRHRVIRSQQRKKHLTRRRECISCVYIEGGKQKEIAARSLRTIY